MTQPPPHTIPNNNKPLKSKQLPHSNTHTNWRGKQWTTHRADFTLNFGRVDRGDLIVGRVDQRMDGYFRFLSIGGRWHKLEFVVKCAFNYDMVLLLWKLFFLIDFQFSRVFKDPVRNSRIFKQTTRDCHFYQIAVPTLSLVEMPIGVSTGRNADRNLYQ